MTGSVCTQAVGARVVVDIEKLSPIDGDIGADFGESAKLEAGSMQIAAMHILAGEGRGGTTPLGSGGDSRRRSPSTVSAQADGFGDGAAGSATAADVSTAEAQA